MRNLIILFLLLTLSLPGANVYALRNVALDAPKRVVVLDPGHGGPRPGKVLGDVVEKDYVLDVTKIVRKRIIDTAGGSAGSRCQ